MVNCRDDEAGTITQHMKKLFIIILSIIVVLITALFVKGKPGISNLLYYQKEHSTAVGGPFESSNSTSRYALTEALAVDHSFFLNRSLASFASPDVAEYNGKFFTLFTPGVSLITVPFFLLGNQFGLPQLFTYFATNLFAFFNFYLIARLARKLGANFYSSALSGLLFLFATNAFAYSFTLTQHHYSVTFILLMLLNSLQKRSTWNDLLFGAYFGVAILLDIPNACIALPIALYVAWQHFDMQTINNTIKVKISFIGIAIAIGLLPFIGFFGYYNHLTANSYTKLAQTIGRTSAFKDPSQLAIDQAHDAQKSEVEVDPNRNESSIPSIFNTRRQLAGTYLLLISDERGWLYYSPVMAIGILGLFLGYQKKKTRVMVILISATALMTLMVYSMFSDPWGGWSFGPRYLLPATAVVSAGIGLALEWAQKKWFLLPIMIGIVGYSIFINDLGAMTTASIPPKVEAQNLNVPIPYTYQYNFNLLDTNLSSSLMFNEFAHKFWTARQYLYVSDALISLLVLSVFGLSFYEGRKHV